MGKKGVSLDEKRSKILSVFHTSLRPFVLKDVEKLASKLGVVQNTVKDVLASLTDDQLVDMDKIGATNWFWSFPSKESAARRAKARATADKIAELERTLAELEQKKAEALKTRPVSDQRTARLAELAEATKRRKELQERLDLAKENDPEKGRVLQAEVKHAKEGVERWVNNTWAIVDWLKKSHGMTRAMAQKQLGIDDEFDVPVFSATAAKGKQQA